jgi:AcrR family transcriptional regulator
MTKVETTNKVNTDTVARPSNSTNAREAILDAALEEFSCYGFQGTSVRNIGKRAQVDFTLITYYFKTKENLWKAVVSRSVERHAEVVLNKMKETENLSPGAKLRARMMSELEFAYSGDSLFKLGMFEIHTDSDRSHWLFDNFIKESQATLVELIKAAQINGEITTGNPLLLARLIQTSIRSLLLGANEFERVEANNHQTEVAKDELWLLFDQVFFANVHKNSG